MSTEAQVAMLMLRLLLDKPQELQKVLDYLKNQVVVRKAVLEVGNHEVASREEIFREFEDRFGLVIDISDDEVEAEHNTLLSEGMKKRMIGLPGGAKFRVG